MPKTNKIQLNLNADQSLIDREVPSQRILEISVKALKADIQKPRPPLNLALVIDKSGSMSGDKLEYAKQAATFVVDRLQEDDQAALVAFGSHVDLLSSNLKMSNENRAAMKKKISQIKLEGMTNLSGGWLTGCQEVAAKIEETSINRALLLTDGQANEGITDLEELSMHARELANRGVTTSTFGIGLGFNEYLLEAMANQGRGNFYYIETPIGIPDIFMKEFSELSSVTASNVEISIDIPQHVNVEVLGSWSHEFQSGKLKIFAGNLFSGHSLELYVKIMTPPSDHVNELLLPAKLIARDENSNVVESEATLKFQYAEQASVQAEPRNHDLLERFSAVDMADKSIKALKLERAGRREEAHRLMKQTILENRPYMSNEEEVKYTNISQRVQRGMDEFDRKSTHYDEFLRKRRRDTNDL